MKKLQTRKDKEKDVRKVQIMIFVLGLFLIALMIFSSIGFAFSSRSDTDTQISKLKYNGIEFIKNGEYWYFTVDGTEHIAKYSPEEVKDINIVTDHTLSSYQNKPFYYTGVPTEPVIEILRNIESIIMHKNRVCISEENCDGDYPIKNCDENVVLIIQEAGEGESESFIQMQQCAVISASFSNQTRYADAYLYKLLGI